MIILMNNPLIAVYYYFFYIQLILIVPVTAKLICIDIKFVQFGNNYLSESMFSSNVSDDFTTLPGLLPQSVTGLHMSVVLTQIWLNMGY